MWALKEDDAVFPVYGDDTDDPRLWLFSLSRTLTHEKFVEVLVTLWIIWWVIKKFIHEGEHQSPLSTHLFFTGYLEELVFVHRKETRPTTGSARRASPRWYPPPANMATVNVDGAVAKTENRSVGWSGVPRQPETVPGSLAGLSR